VIVTLWDAPYRKCLRVRDLSRLDSEALHVLANLGLDEGETVEKVHRAPLGDPVSIRIGQQLFSLRSDNCRRVMVEEA
jgi:Fe2+ transport system protein FeoA